MKFLKGIFILLLLSISTSIQAQTRFLLECQVSGEHEQPGKRPTKIQEQKITVSVMIDGETHLVIIEGRGSLNFGAIHDKSPLSGPESIYVGSNKKTSIGEVIRTVSINRVTGFIDANETRLSGLNVEGINFSGYCNKIEDKPRF